MKRVFGFIIIFLLSCSVIGYLAYFKSADITSKILSSKFGSFVAVNNVFLHPPKVVIKDIRVSNPPGYSYPMAMGVKTIVSIAPYVEYFKAITTIESITLKDITLVLEFKDKEMKHSNWTTLMQHLSQVQDRHLLDRNRYSKIKLLRFENFTIVIISFDGTKKVQTLPSLSLKNITSKEGSLSKALTQAVIYHMIFNLKNIVNFPVDFTKNAIGDFFDGIGSIFYSPPPDHQKQDQKER